ncbi:hypothetical protein [Robinsoniella peoriensis]
MEGRIERKGYKSNIFLLLGVLLSFSLLLTLPYRAYAAEAESKTIQQQSPGNKEPVQGNGKVDVDGTVKAKNGSTASSGKSSASKQSKPSTTQVGNGLNDKLTQNAKTGDLNRNLVFVILLIVSVIVLAVVLKQRTARNKQ